MEEIISYKNYSKSITTFFEFLKKTKNTKELYLKSIKIKKHKDLLLVPVCHLHLNDQSIIKKFSDWRNKYSNVFYPNIKTNIKNTKIWLENNLLKSKDRILFIVLKDGNKLLGHVGFDDCLNKNMNFKLANLIKGETEIDRNIFYDVVNSLINWANSTFYINNITCLTRCNNHRAIYFLKKINFKIFEDKNNKLKNTYVSMIYKKKLNSNRLILTAGPSISQKEVFYVNDAVENGWNKNANFYIKKLEKAFANYLNCKYAISTSSCTGAMQIALMALGIKSGDEVIVPNTTWVATANAVSYVNATPVFADINLEDWTIDPDSIEKLITKKTKAIIPVHLYGQPANMEKIIKISKKYNLYVVEDAAPAIGAKFKNKKCGTFGNFGAFSFQGAKLLVSGEGGMLVTNDHVLYKRAQKIANQGRNEKKTFYIDSVGVKFKMSNVQAALALGQLERIEELIAFKRRIFSWYKKYLNNIKPIYLNYEADNTKSIYWMSSLILKKNVNIKRDILIKKLLKNKIHTRPVFPELSSFKIWGNGNSNLKFKNSNFLSSNALNLPSGVCLNESEIKDVCNKIKIILKSI